MKRVAVVGSGFSGLSSAAYLRKQGFEVEVFEKNLVPGGRARTFSSDGYTFDMGPSWYWMPDVFEKYFNDFGYSVSDFYELQLLDPGFTIVFDENKMSIPADYNSLLQLFESIEPGAAIKLDQFMQEAEIKYELGINKLVYKPGLSITEFIDKDILSNIFRLQVFTSFSKHIAKYFTSPKLKALMEFPVLFLGAMPSDTPALYSLMNYAGLKLGTWYPEGGFGSVINAMVTVAKEQGVQFHFNAPVQKILVENSKTTGLLVNDQEHFFDAVVAAADYHHIESRLLPEKYRNYTEDYWESKTFAPSCLIYYLGINKGLDLDHHTLFFEEDLNQHSEEIYKNAQWPTKPLFYVCCPSKTDDTVAPQGCENLFLLMPIAPGLEDNEDIREHYFKIMLSRIEKHTNETNLAKHIQFKRSYCVADFIGDYNSYKGNAYGLANTLKQTAILKPKIINRKIKNLFYAGQLTVPGPGVPPSLISGKIVAQQVINLFKHSMHEVTL
jgi:phytoene desaturase